jgi:hypothetical protein
VRIFNILPLQNANHPTFRPFVCGSNWTFLRTFKSDTIKPDVPSAKKSADSGPKKRHSKTRKRTLYYIMSVVEFKLRQQRYGISLHVQNFSRTFA